MGRFIIGGYSRDVVYNMTDQVCRAIQNVVLTHLESGKGLFYRSAGELNGSEVQSVVWLSPSSALRFEYDTDLFPDLDESLASSYRNHVESFGGIIIPSNAEVDGWSLEDETEDAKT